MFKQIKGTTIYVPMPEEMENPCLIDWSKVETDFYSFTEECERYGF